MMFSPHSRINSVQIGSCSFQRRSGEVSCGCAERRLEPIVAEVLEVLIAHAGDVVARDEILDVVWRERVVVEESVTRAISHIRRAFGDTSRPHRYVQTLSKRGYRLIAPVTATQARHALPAPPNSLVGPPGNPAVV